MGSSSSSAAEENAEWVDGDWLRCRHGEEDYVCEYVRWYKVPMGCGFCRCCTEVGRGLAAVATLGLSTVVNGGIRDYSHDYVRLRVRCRKCGREMPWSTEFSKSGIENRYGRYNKYYSIEKQRSINVPLTTVKSALPVHRTYSLRNYNCEHYASEAYGIIISAG
jgi:hypothetical protein